MTCTPTSTRCGATRGRPVADSERWPISYASSSRSHGWPQRCGLGDRQELARCFDKLRRDVDSRGTLSAMDRFDQQAYELVAGPAARKAFDIDYEDPRMRDKYGRHSWGQSTLLARRLVEAGSTFVTVHFGGWDHHWDLKAGMERYLPMVDQAVSALFDDLSTRGLYDQVLVVLCGERGATPVLNTGTLYSG